MEPSHYKYHHPYEPYDIQLDFMQKLYQCIEDSQVGIFESPTGTGKSLSLICASLTWLRDDERRRLLGQPQQNCTSLDWLAQAERDIQLQNLLRTRKEFEDKLKAVRVRAAKDQRLHERVKRVKVDVSFQEDDLALDDYFSDDGEQAKAIDDNQFSSSTLALLNQLKPAKSAEDDAESENRPKVFFCSRTHSQLTQFVDELRKVNIPSAVSDIEESEIIKHIPLGSRRNLCINPKVSALTTATAITERCLELQKPGKSKDHKCEFMISPNSAEQKERLENFKDNAIANIQNIEEIAQLGRKLKMCPYYASRSAIPVSEVLTLPYPLLLQKSAREAMGVSVKDNVVIIDEAHNLVSAIADTLSTSMPLSHLELVHKQVMGYCQKYKNRLKGKNRVYLAQIIRVIKSCIIRVRAEFNSITDTIISANDLIADAGSDQIQPFKLVKYIHDSKLVYKVEGFAELLDGTTNGAQLRPGHQKQPATPKGLLAEFQNLLVALVNPASEGQFFVLKVDGELVLKYSLLDPQAHFEDIAKDARAVILAGGTMSPMSDYAEQLFSYLDPTRIKMYSFGHVIDSKNLLVEPLVTGPTGIDFEFTWQNRNKKSMVSELASALEKICMLTPDGIVAFFSSYEYLAFVISVWKTGSPSAFDKILSQKQIFQESQEINVDEMLGEYALAVMSRKGALMLAVIGGKLSEGINFSDRLGRAVVCVGLPYPNIKSAEWSSKIEHIEKITYSKSRGRGIEEDECKKKAQLAGREYTLNTTMRAVNQSIGRAIRHKNDYAAIYLVDKRYATSRIQAKLPEWLSRSMRPINVSWKDTERNCARFFEEKTQH